MNLIQAKAMAFLVYRSILISLAALLFIKLLLSHTRDRKNNKLPPSPPALPVIGHLHLLKKPLHQTLASISGKYGPATFLKFGSWPVLVISSRSLAVQCFTTYEMAFANRPHWPSVKQATFDYNHIGAANYGPYWRNVRQIAATEFLSAQRLHESSDVRVGEVRDMARRLFLSWNASAGSKDLSYFVKVDLKEKLFELSLNVMMAMIAGKGSTETTFRTWKRRKGSGRWWRSSFPWSALRMQRTTCRFSSFSAWQKRPRS